MLPHLVRATMGNRYGQMFQGVASFLDIPLGCIFNGGVPPTRRLLRMGILGGKEGNPKASPLVFSVRP